MKKIYFIIIAIISIVYVAAEVRKKKFSIKESFYWIIASLVMLILAIFPQIFDKLAIMIGIDYAPSLLFLICIVFLLFINFRNSKKISEQNEKIIELAQEITIIKKRTVNEKKE